MYETKVPAEDELPNSIKELSYKNSLLTRSDPDFSNDIKKLTTELQSIIKKQKRRISSYVYFIISIILLSLFGLYIFGKSINITKTIHYNDDINYSSESNNYTFQSESIEKDFIKNSEDVDKGFYIKVYSGSDEDKARTIVETLISTTTKIKKYFTPKYIETKDGFIIVISKLPDKIIKSLNDKSQSQKNKDKLLKLMIENYNDLLKEEVGFKLNEDVSLIHIK